MKKTFKIILLVALAIGILIVCSACSIGNRQYGIDTKQTFRVASIYLDGEWRRVNVKGWRDYDDGIIQITTDNDTYLMHQVNINMMEKGTEFK